MTMIRRLAIVASVTCAALAAAPALAEPAMWTVKDADSTIYLFGTVHVLRPERAWMTPRLQQALDSCQDLTLEIGDSGADAVGPLIGRYGFDPSRKLSDTLSPAQRARLATAIAELGADPAHFESMRPWLAGLQLTLAAVTKAGFNVDAGVEKLLRAKSKADGEPVLALETAESQIVLLANLPDDIQNAFLIESLDEFGRAAELLDAMAQAWERGDEATLDKLVNQDMRRVSETLYRMLLVERNVRFAAQIKQQLAGAGTHCVAVGAGHLVGRDSVQALLRKIGIASERF